MSIYDALVFVIAVPLTVTACLFAFAALRRAV